MQSYILIVINILFNMIGATSQTEFYGNGTIGPYLLKDNKIFIDSDSVLVNDVFISRENYQIDYNLGTITFDFPLTETSLVIVRYKKIPFSLESKNYHSFLLNYNKTDSSQQTNKLEKKQQFEDINSDLQLAGSKVIAIGLGSNYGMNLEQATRMTLAGNIDGINISGELTDVNNPIPAEGTTKDIEEFDKIFINIKNDKFNCFYGDNDLRQSIGNIGYINRKVIGASFDYNFEPNRINVGYVKTKGKYQRVLIEGKDNKQGPYYLTQNLNNISIIPGSENVYINGKRLVRGSDEDYVIDYSQGTITFTNRQIINSFTRIEIDFEYIANNYYRYLWYLNSQYQLTSNLSIQGQLFSEADNKFQNLSYMLSDDDINYLKTIDAESNHVWLSGVKYVGSGNGSYIKQQDHFIYVGAGSGDYEVKFSYVGINNGSYDYNSISGGFDYVGEHQGKYIPGVDIQLPEQSRILTSNIKYESPIGISVYWQGLLSQQDKNLFANSNKTKTKGLGYLFDGTYQNENFQIKYHRAEFNPKFYFPYNYNDIDFSYLWVNIKQESLKTNNEIDIRIQPFNLFNIAAGYGWIQNQDNVSRQRYFWSHDIFPNSKELAINYHIEHFPNLFSRYSINIKPQYKIFYPRLLMFWQRGNNTNERQLIPSLQIKNEQNLDVKFELDIKERFGENYKSNKIYKIENRWLKDNIYINSIIGYQTNKINNDIQDNNFFGNFNINYKIFKGFTMSFNFQEQHGELQTFETNYLWVGKGLGNYNKNPETQEYYLEPNGEYIQEMIPSGNFIQTKNRNIQMNCLFDRLQIINFDGNLIAEQQFSKETQIQNLLNRRLNLNILPYNKLLSLRIVNNYNSSQDNVYHLYPFEAKDNNNRLELISQFTNDIQWQLSFEYNHQKKERKNIAVEYQRKEQIYSVCPTFYYNINLKAEFIHSRAYIVKPLYYSNLGGFWLYKWQLNLERNWEINKITNINTVAILSYRTATIEHLPYDINLLEPMGITPQLKINFERIIPTDLNNTFKQIILSGNYSFLKYPMRKTEQIFSLKLQTIF